jgi:hypothetical protein
MWVVNMFVCNYVCQEQLRRILMSVGGMSSRHFSYTADAFEFGFEDERRGNQETCSGHIQLYVQRIAGVPRTSARTMQKTVPLVDFQSRAAKRRRFPEVLENTAVAIFRVNNDAGIVVALVSCMEVLAGSGWEYEVSIG